MKLVFFFQLSPNQGTKNRILALPTTFPHLILS